MSHPLKAWVEREGALLRLRLGRPEGEHRRRRDDRGAARRARRAPREPRACAACCSTPRGRTSASAPASRSTCPSAAPRCCRAARAAPAHARVRRCRSWSRCAANAWAAASRWRWPAARSSPRPTRRLGQPEIKLGVFAPAASVLLPDADRPARARTCCLAAARSAARSRRDAAWRTRLADDPEAAALAYFEQHLQAKSAAALRLRRHGGARADRRATCADAWPKSSASISTS